jgi:hypothetical protein
VGCLVCRFPFEGLRILAVSQFPLPETSMPLMELAAFQSLMNVSLVDV